MAWGAFAFRGSAANKTAGPLLTVAPNANLLVDDVVIAIAVTDNIATGGGATNNHNLCDTEKNSWQRAFEFSNAAAAAAGITLSVWVTMVTQQIPTTGAVYLVTTGNTTAHAIGLYKATVGAGRCFGIVSAAQSQQDATQAPTVTLNGLVSQEYAILGIVARENDNAGIYTMDADYTDQTKFGTTGGTADTNVSCIVGTRLATLTGDTFAPTSLSAAADVVTALVALYEAPAINLSITAVKTTGPKHVISFSDKTQVELAGLAQIQDYAFGNVTRETAKSMMIARWLAVDPAAANPNILVGRRILLTNGRNAIAEGR